VIQFSKDAFHGNGQNRWYDKPLQWIVFDSGEAAFIGEHSCMDGTPTGGFTNFYVRENQADVEAWPFSAKVNDYIGHRLSKRDFPKGGSDNQLSPTYLPFESDANTRASVSEATSSYSKAVSEQALDYLHYARYGKEGIKAQKCSPDGWVQMVMQLAYGLTFPEEPVTGTYEAAMTRKFALGRTETVRVCSAASKAFVLAMLDKSGKVSDQEKRKLFMDALAQHGKDMKDASNAQGIDRHIFGLKMINAEYPDILEGTGKVELFDDDRFRRSGTWKLSTSLIYSKYFRGYGWGQVVPDGFGAFSYTQLHLCRQNRLLSACFMLGLPYSIHDNHLVWTVTSKKSQKTAEYTANLKKAADMLMDMSEHALQEQGQQDQAKAKL
jgi:carnitine O-acetyltransferase